MSEKRSSAPKKQVVGTQHTLSETFEGGGGKVCGVSEVCSNLSAPPGAAAPGCCGGGRLLDDLWWWELELEPEEPLLLRFDEDDFSLK